jgi:hypothetical protein
MSAQTPGTIGNTQSGATAPAPAAATAPQATLPAANDLAALISEAVKTHATPLMKALEAERAKVATLEAEQRRAVDSVTKAATEKASVEEQLNQVRAELAKQAEASKNSRLDAALKDAASRYKHVSEQAGEHSRSLFAQAHKIEVSEDGTVTATGSDGTRRPIQQAYEAWVGGPGAIFKAAASQPGPATPPPASPGGQQAKNVRDLSTEEFDALLRQGVKGKLTNDRRAPEITIKRTTNPFQARRDSLIGRFGAAGPGKAT